MSFQLHFDTTPDDPQVVDVQRTQMLKVPYIQYEFIWVEYIFFMIIICIFSVEIYTRNGAILCKLSRLERESDHGALPLQHWPVKLVFFFLFFILLKMAMITFYTVTRSQLPLKNLPLNLWWLAW